MISSESTSLKLLKQEDWLAWFDFIRSKATAEGIWRFVNPEEEAPPTNVRPDLLYYTRNRATTSTSEGSTATNACTNPHQEGQIPDQPSESTPKSTSILAKPPSDPELEQCLATLDSAGRWNIYKIHLARYDENEKSIAALSELIRLTVGPNFMGYLSHEHNPHKLLRTLQLVAKPSNDALQRSIKSDLERLEAGPKHLGLEAWLSLYFKISKMAEQVDNPPHEASTPSLMQHLVKSSQLINPGFYAAFSLKADEGALKLTLEELISKFNISYKPPKGNRAAFPTLAGESTDEPQDNPPNPTPSNTQRHKRECLACGGFHNVKKCRNLFEELRPDDWVVRKDRERRCQEYIKTPEGKALYLEQKKLFTAQPPEKPTLKPSPTKRKATQDPESAQLCTAAVLKQPPTALTAREVPDIDLSTSWTYATGANVHVGNNINHFLNYTEVQLTHMATGSSSSTIHGYGDVKLSIQCGERSRDFTLKHVAYCPGFHTNIVCADTLFEAGIENRPEIKQPCVSTNRRPLCRPHQIQQTPTPKGLCP